MSYMVDIVNLLRSYASLGSTVARDIIIGDYRYTISGTYSPSFTVSDLQGMNILNVVVPFSTRMTFPNNYNSSNNIKEEDYHATKFVETQWGVNEFVLCYYELNISNKHIPDGLKMVYEKRKFFTTESQTVIDFESEESVFQQSLICPISYVDGMKALEMSSELYNGLSGIESFIMISVKCDMVNELDYENIRNVLAQLIVSPR